MCSSQIKQEQSLRLPITDTQKDQRYLLQLTNQAPILPSADSSEENDHWFHLQLKNERNQLVLSSADHIYQMDQRYLLQLTNQATVLTSGFKREENGYCFICSSQMKNTSAPVS